MSSFNDRKDGVDSFWHLLFTSGLFSHWEYVQTWEVAELLPVSILEVYSLPARTPKKKMRQRWSVGFRSGLCCVSKMPKERAKREVEKSIFYFILKCFLYLSITQCPVVVFAVCNLLLFFTNSTGKHFSIVLFLGCCFFVFCFFFFLELMSHVLCLTYFWEQVVLIYGDFITRKECFLNASLLLTPPFQNTHACTLCSVVIMKKHFLVFSIKSRSLGRKRSENMNMTANRKKQT